jgi:hypothetical protein
MKDDTFLKYAKKLGLRDGMYSRKLKDGTIYWFFYAGKSVSSSRHKPGSHEYNGILMARSFHLKLDKKDGRKNMKDIIRAIKKAKAERR